MTWKPMRILAYILAVASSTLAMGQVDADLDGIPDQTPFTGTMSLHAPSSSTGPRMLVDRIHSMRFDYTGFANYLVSLGWTVDEIQQGEITFEALRDYDVLLTLPSGAALDSEEAEAVGLFVRRGGSAWIHHDYSQNPSGPNSVSSQFGVEFNNDKLEDPTNNEGRVFWPTITLFNDHPVFRNVSSYGYYAGCSLDIGAALRAAANGDDDCWSAFYDAYPPTMAILEPGNGRVICSGEMTTWHPSMWPSGLRAEEVRLLVQCAEWLASKSWSSNYGTGLPGTLGVPSLALDAPPRIGSDVTLQIGNSLGTSALGLLFVGFERASTFGWGGELLVDPTWTLLVSIPPAGLGLQTSLDADPGLIGLRVYSQCLASDPGAVRGFSFTPGLEVRIGR